MTGLDCLREELEKRGLSKAQINSKVAAVVLDVVARSGDKYTQMWKSEEEASKRERELEIAIMRAESRLQDLEIRILNAKGALDLYEEKKRKVEEYVNKFIDSLSDCETPEGRDTMRIAQMFTNSVSVDTKYDNTAYIIGLAAILSKGGISAMDELKKINKNMPSVDNGWITHKTGRPGRF